LCKVALAPGKIQNAVQKVTEDALRSKNFVINGVEAENLDVRVAGMLQELDEKLQILTSGLSDWNKQRQNVTWQRTHLEKNCIPTSFKTSIFFKEFFTFYIF
jgi:hypothetical protein